MQSQGGSGSWAREGQVPGNRAIIQITVNRRNLLLKMESGRSVSWPFGFVECHTAKFAVLS